MHTSTSLGLQAHHLHAASGISNGHDLGHATSTRISITARRMVDGRPGILEDHHQPARDWRCYLAAVLRYGGLDHKPHTAPTNAERPLPTQSSRPCGDAILLVVMHTTVWTSADDPTCHTYLHTIGQECIVITGPALPHPGRCMGQSVGE